MRIATYNVHKCVGRDRLFDPERTLAVVGELGADVAALQEMDRRLRRPRAILDPAAVERATGCVLVSAPARDDLLGWHGNALLVRRGLRHGPARRIVLPGPEPRGAVAVDVETPGGPVRFAAAHLALYGPLRSAQMARLVDAVLDGWSGPAVVMGDLNEWHPAGRCVRAAALRLPGTHAAVASFPSARPFLALDRILARPAGMVGEVEAHDTPLSRVASDHLPLKAVLRLA